MAVLETLVLDGLALNDDTALTMEALDMTPPPELEEWVKGADSDGALLARAPLCDNRTITATVRVDRTATMDLALAKVALIVDKLKECQRNANGLALTWLPHDSALPAITFRCLSGQIVGMPIDAQSGWLVNSPSLQLKLTCLPFGEGPEVASHMNESTNPGFEVSTAGFGTAPSFRNATGATLTRVTSGQRTGTGALRIVTTAVNLQGADYTTMNVVAGQPKTVSVWAKGNAGGEPVLLFLGDGTVGSTNVAATLTTSYQLITATLTPTATGTTGWALVQSTASIKTFFIDDNVIANGTSAPSQLDGDMGAGYAWLGTTGLSRSAGPNAVVTTDPIAVLIVENVAGDVQAPGRLTVTDNAAQSRRYVAWGQESRHLPLTSPPSLIIDSTSMITAGYAGTTGTTIGAYSGGSNNTIGTILRTQPQACCGLPLALAHVGTFRPQLRFYCSAPTLACRLTFQTLDGPFRSLSYQVPVTAFWNQVDLGQITIDPAVLGNQKWTGRIEAYSTASGGESFNVDAIWMMPAEQYARAIGAYSYQPGVVVAYDEFAAIAAGTVLNARIAPSTGGPAWTTLGGVTDLAAADAPAATDETMARSTTADGAFPANIRSARLGATNYTDTDVSVDVRVTASVGSRQAVLARWVDNNNHLSLSIDSGTAFLEVTTASTVAVRAGQVIGGWSPNVWYTLRIVVYASGNAFAFVYDTAGNQLVSLFLWDDAIAPAGSLDDGKPGFYDFNNSGGAATRYFDRFYMSTPSAEPIACYAGRSIQFRSDCTLRDDAAGVYAGRPSEILGSYFSLAPAGGPDRENRIAVIARRNDITLGQDSTITDSLVVQASYTPQYLVVPRA